MIPLFGLHMNLMAKQLEKQKMTQVCSVAKAESVIGSLPFRVCRQLMIKLNPLLTGKGDFRDLSCEMGYKWDQIIYFQSLQDPMDAVLRGCRNIPIEQLMTKLEKIGRPDARSVVEEYITESCKCAKCNS